MSFGIHGILFYSEKCKYSHNLRKIMDDQDLLKLFTQRSIEKMSDDELYKMGLKVVPTLVVLSSNGNSQVKQIYEEMKAFEWIDSVMKNRRESLIKTAENTRKLIQLNNNKMKSNNSLYEHNPLETSGISDSYSSWRDNINEDIDFAHKKNFLPYGKDDQYKIIALPDSNNNPKLSINEQSIKIRQLEVARSQQDSTIKQAYEKQHLESVIKTEIGEYAF